MEKWNEAETIATWIVIGIFLVILFSTLIVKLIYINFTKQIQTQQRENQLKLDYQKQLIENSILVQERERDRIAADLHDSLIGKLTAIQIKSHTSIDSEELKSSLHECIGDARRISHDLTPPMINYMDLDELVENLINTWHKTLSISFYKNVFPVNISSEFKLQIFRILQELIVNIYKHAESNWVKIHLRITKKKIAFIVNDNGKGFDINKNANGLGMKNIELRVLYLNGFHKFKSSSNGTTSIFIFNLNY